MVQPEDDIQVHDVLSIYIPKETNATMKAATNEGKNV